MSYIKPIPFKSFFFKLINWKKGKGTERLTKTQPEVGRIIVDILNYKVNESMSQIFYPYRLHLSNPMK